MFPIWSKQKRILYHYPFPHQWLQQWAYGPFDIQNYGRTVAMRSRSLSWTAHNCREHTYYSRKAQFSYDHNRQRTWCWSFSKCPNRNAQVLSQLSVFWYSVKSVYAKSKAGNLSSSRFYDAGHVRKHSLSRPVPEAHIPCEIWRSFSPYMSRSLPI